MTLLALALLIVGAWLASRPGYQPRIERQRHVLGSAALVSVLKGKR